jgi:hypothetical protein
MPIQIGKANHKRGTPMEMFTTQRVRKHTALRLAIAVGSVFAIPAFGQAPPPPAASSSPVESNGPAVQGYWTNQNLASAIPMPLPKVTPTTLLNTYPPPSAPAPIKLGAGGLPTIQLGPASANVAESFPLNRGGTEASVLPATGFSYEMPFSNFRAGINNVYPYTTIGKLFFVIPSGASQPAGNYVCSAAVAIDSHTVVTARHCMYDYSTSKWYSNWYFAPGWTSLLPRSDPVTLG